jgi:hypothetical protein
VWVPIPREFASFVLCAFQWRVDSVWITCDLGPEAESLLINDIAKVVVHSHKLTMDLRVIRPSEDFLTHPVRVGK